MGIIKAVIVEVARTALEERQRPQSDYRGGNQGNQRSIAGSSSTSVPTSVPTTVYREQRYPYDTKRPEGPQTTQLYDEAPPLYHEINQSTSERDISRSHVTNQSHNRTIIREPMDGTNTDNHNHSHSSNRNVTVSSEQYDDAEFPGFGTRLRRRLADRLDEHASRPSRKDQRKMLKEEKKHAKKVERYQRD